MDSRSLFKRLATIAMCYGARTAWLRDCSLWNTKFEKGGVGTIAICIGFVRFGPARVQDPRPSSGNGLITQTVPALKADTVRAIFRVARTLETWEGGVGCMGRVDMPQLGIY